MCLNQVDNAIGNAPATAVDQYLLLTVQLATCQKLALPVTPQPMKAGARGDQAVDGFEITLYIAQMPPDCSLNLTPTRFLLLGNLKIM